MHVCCRKRPDHRRLSMLVITTFRMTNSSHFICCFASLKQAAVKGKPAEGTRVRLGSDEDIRTSFTRRSMPSLRTERPHRRIRESSAAATQRAARQPSGPQHFETYPLQRGLTGNDTLAVLDAQLPRTHRHTPLQTVAETDIHTEFHSLNLRPIFYKDVRLHAERTSFMQLPTPGLLWE